MDGLGVVCAGGGTSKRWRVLWVLLTLAIGLLGCADVEHVGWALASSKKPAVMRRAGQTLEGLVQLRPDRTGSIEMHSAGAQAAQCAGSLRFTGVYQGVMDIRCNDGAMFDMPFQLLNEVKGFAFGFDQKTPVALAFGMTAGEAAAYLARVQPEAASVLDTPSSLKPAAAPSSAAPAAASPPLATPSAASATP